MEYKECLKQLFRCQNKSIALQKAGLATQVKLSVDLIAHGAKVLLIARSRDELGTLQSLISVFTSEGGHNVLKSNNIFNNTWVTLSPFTSRSLSKEGWAERLAALYALRYGKVQGLILTIDNLLPKEVPLDFFDNQVIQLSVGEELSPDIILEQAITWGYDRVSMVSNPGVYHDVVIFLTLCLQDITILSV